MYFADDAADRVITMLESYDTNQVAEIIADLLHYCTKHDIDFQEQLHRAQGYVDAELELDQAP